LVAAPRVEHMRCGSGSRCIAGNCGCFAGRLCGKA
jgi:hypothetical protein